MLIKHGFGLAPMAGYTDKAMRQLCHRFGCDWTVTEMISAKALCYKNAKSFKLLDLKDESQVSVQLFGSEPDIMAEGARIVADSGAEEIDINMGCPVPKVTGNGEGSALLNDPERAAAIVGAMTSAVAIPVTVKMRIGWNAPMNNIGDFAKRLSDAGAAAICVHGRTRQQYYTGTANWKVIADVVEAVNIPVYANGDVDSVEKGLSILEETKAHAVMIGRGALGQPWLFRSLKDAVAGNPITPEPTIFERMTILKEQAEATVYYKGEYQGIRELRKVLGWYAKGLPGATDFRRAMGQLSSLSDLDRILHQWICALKNKSHTGGE